MDYGNPALSVPHDFPHGVPSKIPFFWLAYALSATSFSASSKLICCQLHATLDKRFAYPVSYIIARLDGTTILSSFIGKGVIEAKELPSYIIGSWIGNPEQLTNR